MASTILLIAALAFGVGLYWIGTQMQRELDRRKQH